MRSLDAIGAREGSRLGLGTHPSPERVGGAARAPVIRSLDIGEPVRTVELPAEKPLVLPHPEPKPQPSEPRKVPVRVGA